VEASRVIKRYLQDILLAVTSQSATPAKLDATSSQQAQHDQAFAAWQAKCMASDESVGDYNGPMASELFSTGAANQADVDQMTAGGSLSRNGIQTAVRVHLPNKHGLAKHADSEGTKAVTSYTSNVGKVGADRPAARCAGLQFEVEKLERC